MRDGNIRADHTMAPNHHARTDYGVRPNLCAFADFNLRTDHHARRDLRPFTDFRCAADWLIVPSNRLVLRVKNPGKSSKGRGRLGGWQNEQSIALSNFDG